MANIQHAFFASKQTRVEPSKIVNEIFIERMKVILLLVICLSCLLGSLAKISSNSLSMINSRNNLIESKAKFSIQTIAAIRGGAKATEEEVDEEEEIDEEGEEDDDIQLGTGAGGVKDNAIVNSITDLIKKTPPITKVYIFSSIFLTLSTFFLNKNTWPEFLHLTWKPVITKFQFWRPFTAFLFFGPLGLNYILTIQFVWTYMAQLEKLNYNKPADFFIQLLFGCITLLISYTILGMYIHYLLYLLITYIRRYMSYLYTI